MSGSGPGQAVLGVPRQRLVLHVGVPKSGTSFLQGLLASNRELLRAAGFIYPFIRPEGMFHAAVELRGQHRLWGLDPAVVDGSWARLLERVRGFDGTGVISHELLAGASPAVLERVAADTADFDVEVVVTARNLGRQATAHWQEEVKNGRAWSFDEFRGELWRPGESVASEMGFWRSQDLLDVMARWTAVAPPERVHLVVVPSVGSAPGLLWERYAAAIGLDPATLDPTARPVVNESLGAAQVALLRQVVAALGGRLEQPRYARIVKRLFAQRLLAGIRSAPATTPEDLREELDRVVHTWLTELRARGHPVHGDLDELLSTPSPGAPHPDDVRAEQLLSGLPEVIAELLLELADAREGEPGDGHGVDERPGGRRRWSRRRR